MLLINILIALLTLILSCIPRCVALKIAISSPGFGASIHPLIAFSQNLTSSGHQIQFFSHSNMMEYVVEKVPNVEFISIGASPYLEKIVPNLKDLNSVITSFRFSAYPNLVSDVYSKIDTAYYESMAQKIKMKELDINEIDFWVSDISFISSVDLIESTHQHKEEEQEQQENNRSHSPVLLFNSPYLRPRIGFDGTWSLPYFGSGNDAEEVSWSSKIKNFITPHAMSLSIFSSYLALNNRKMERGSKVFESMEMVFGSSPLMFNTLPHFNLEDRLTKAILPSNPSYPITPHLHYTTFPNHHSLKPPPNPPYNNGNDEIKSSFVDKEEVTTVYVLFHELHFLTTFKLDTLLHGLFAHPLSQSSLKHHEEEHENSKLGDLALSDYQQAMMSLSDEFYDQLEEYSLNSFQDEDLDEILTSLQFQSTLKIKIHIITYHSQHFISTHFPQVDAKLKVELEQHSNQLQISFSVIDAQDFIFTSQQTINSQFLILTDCSSFVEFIFI